jgi:V8-like Glu-specific endopeptidase
MKFLIIAILIYFGTFTAHTQCDTLVVYDVDNGTIQFMPIPCNPDSLDIYGEILNSEGSMAGGATLLSNSPSNPFNPLSLAQNNYNLLSYPTRTNVALIWSADTLLQQYASCSGTLISNNIVLTAGHCIGDHNVFDEFNWNGGAYVSPSLDNGFPQSQFGNLKVKYKIVRKDYYDNGTALWYENDIGLLVLENPIGSSSGWLGLSFHKNDSIINVNDSLVSHNFCYPSLPSYNGESMYNTYGIASINWTNRYAYDGIVAVSGQSGSSLFYEDGTKKMIYAIRITSNIYKMISQRNFWAIKNVMLNSNILEIKDADYESFQSTSLAPNPMINESILSLKSISNHNNQNMAYSVFVYDAYGRILIEDVLGDDGTYLLRKSQLDSGTYTICISNKSGPIARNKLIVL